MANEKITVPERGWLGLMVRAGQERKSEQEHDTRLAEALTHRDYCRNVCGDYGASDTGDGMTASVDILNEVLEQCFGGLEFDGRPAYTIKEVEQALIVTNNITGAVVRFQFDEFRQVYDFSVSASPTQS